MFISQCDPVSGCGYKYPRELDHCPKCKASSAFSSLSQFDPSVYVYDIESYPNVCTCCIIHFDTGQQWKFEISDRINQISELMSFLFWLRNNDCVMVGFNNINYDYPVLHFIINSFGITATDIYAKSKSIIDSNFNDNSHVIWESDCFVKQIDLLKIWHFNNKNRMTSLKALEIAMRMDDVQDLPYKPGTFLTFSQIDKLNEYNRHDVIATCRFLARSITQIQLRRKLSESLGLNLINCSDVKMGEKILVSEMEKKGIRCYERINGIKTPIQTWRGEINLSDVIFNYITFEREEFKAIHKWFKSKKITKTKEAFKDMVVDDDIFKFVNPDEIKVNGLAKTSRRLSKIKPGTDLSKCTMTMDSPNIVCEGLTYYFGTGGLHASITSQVIESNENNTIVDVDVKSFYPKLGIENKLFPAHLGVEFCEAFAEVYNVRDSYPKNMPENGAFKLALNGAYGGSKNEFSPFLDAFYTMSTTVNGQLLLCVLAEQLMKVPGLKIIQGNTDGITFISPNDYLNHVREVCKWWEKLTCLELEEVLYSRMFIRDVNNYMAEKMSDGSIKRIGAYAHERQDENPATRESTYNKDPSALIIPMAAEEVLVRGKDLREFITSHKNKFDFMLRVKVRKVDKVVLRWSEISVDVEQQRTGRYYISHAGGSLVVRTPPSGKINTWKRKNGISDSLFNSVMAELYNVDKTNIPHENLDASGIPHDERIHTKNRSKYVFGESGLSVGWKVTMCNNIKEFKWSNLNYEYYISEAAKLIDVLKGD